MKTPEITRVRSTFGMPSERPLCWYDDEIHPYAYLDGYVVRVTDVATFTQPVGPDHQPRGAVLDWKTLAEALSVLGWEPA